MSLKQELERFYKTKKFHQLVNVAVRTNRNVGNGSSELLAHQAADDLKDILNTKIQSVDSKRFRERMTGEFTTTVSFKDGIGWVVELNFNPDAARGISLQPDLFEPVYLPKLFNNGWSANGRVWGYWKTAGHIVGSRITREASNFIDNAVSEFNAKYAPLGVYAELASIYTSPDYLYSDMEDGDFDDWMI